MATFIKSEPSMNGTTKPTDAGQLIRGDEWGIDNTLSGFIVQSEDIAEEVIQDVTQDQKGAVVSELDYDKHWTLTLGIIGDTAAGHKWKVNSVTYTGAYNDKKKWSVSCERWINFPPQS